MTSPELTTNARSTLKHCAGGAGSGARASDCPLGQGEAPWQRGPELLGVVRCESCAHIEGERPDLELALELRGPREKKCSVTTVPVAH